MSNERNNDQSRRGVLRAGLMMIGGAAAIATTVSVARAADDDSKVDQATVQYQQTPKDGAKCSGCVNWVAPNACKVVKGTINPEGWCVAYAPKGS